MPGACCGRSTQFSILHLVRDTLDFIDRYNEPAILLTLNQEKVFDRVDHENLFLAHLFVIGSKFSMRMLFLVF